MKKSNSLLMQKYLRKGVKIAKTQTIPRNGTLRPLIDTFEGNDKIQVDYVNDTRERKDPFVIVHRFKNSKQDMSAKKADYFLLQEIKPKKNAKA